MFTCSRFRGATVAGCAVLTLSCLCLPAQTEVTQPSPKELVRETIENEVASSTGPGSHFMFRDTKKTGHSTQTKLIVETREATAGLLVAQNGRPLTPGEQQAEEARLERYLRDPAELTRKRKQEKEDSEHTLRILKALPDAFLYEPDGMVNASPGIGRMGNQLVRLKFHPDPAYQPPTRVEQVLTGMQGNLLIDPKEKRLAQIDGTLEKEVGFGWGILGHLDRGGHFLVEQADVSNNQWELTRMELAFTGKILLVKKLNLHDSEEFSDFRPVPGDLTFAQGIELLKKEVAKMADAGGDGPKSQAANSSARRAPTHNREKDEADGKLCCER
jgi:hypothetical protein